MPIQGVSDIRRLPRIGKIRLGVKVTSPKTQNEYPKAVDYFVVNADDSTSEAAAKAFHEVYGDRPKALRIVIPVSNRDIFFPQWYKAYGAGTGKICQGDGETATRVNRETGEMFEVVCDPDECELYQRKHCKRIGSFSFILPDVRGLGVWTIETTSFHSIVNLNSALDFVQAVAGRVHMIPLTLIVKPQEVQAEGKKKVVYVLDLRADVSLAEIQRLGQVPENRMFLLEAGDDSRPPDDLFPASLVRTYKQAPAGKASPAPASAPEPEPEPEPEADTIEGDAEAVEEEPAPEPDPRAAALEAEIEQGFKALGFTPAKATAWRHKYQNPEELLKALRAEADRVAARQQRTPATKTGQARPNLRPVPSQPAPKQPQPEANGQTRGSSRPAQRAFF